MAKPLLMQAGGKRNPWLRAPVQITFSFVVLIYLGTWLLSLPIASADPQSPLLFRQAFFTSVSATCVTGLSVLSVAESLSGFGQGVLLGLFQLGGLGIMTLAFLVFRSLSRHIGVEGGELLQATLSQSALRSRPRRVMLVVLGGTLAVELLGALCLWPFLRGESDPVWKAIFLSVSAFCNAGFDNLDHGLPAYAGSWPVGLSLLILWLAGGLGFFVPLAWWERKNHGDGLTVRMVIWATAILIPLGALLFYFGEASRPEFAQRPGNQKVLLALFQGNSTRTAGFSMLDLDHIGRFSLISMIPLMLIGGAPGGTAGGIKTTTAWIFLAGLWARLRDQPRVVLWRRSLPQEILRHAIWITVLMVLLQGGFTLILCALEPDPEFRFEALVFESASALATVGLSTGITSELSPASQYTLCLAMFIGRIGPLTLLLALLARPRPTLRFRYPDTEVYIG
ncbi:MAG: Trk family potassium uptake protein [Planctomycetota bacterium]|nr:MAG: Trk family potassium uptake protein [Planctomycetota bacterium]